jgi:hypothetical protein
MNHVKTEIILTSNSSMADRLKVKFKGLHRITIAAVILYIFFVIMFIIVNILICIWNVKINRKKYFLASKNFFNEIDIEIKIYVL